MRFAVFSLALLLMPGTGLRAGCTPQLLWSQAYDDAGQDDQACSVAVDGSGNVIVGGVTSTYNGNTTGSIFVRKYDANGTLVWAKSGIYSGLMGYPQWCAVAVNAAGEIAVAQPGQLGTGGGSYTKLNSNGTAATGWAVPVSLTGAIAVAISSGGTVFAWGQGNLVGRSADGLTQFFTQSVGTTGNTIAGLALDGAGGLYYAGPSSFEGWVVQKRSATTGLLTWSTPSASGTARCIAVEGPGIIYAGGTSQSNTNSPNEPVSFLIRKYNGTTGALAGEFTSSAGTVTTSNNNMQSGAWGIAAAADGSGVAVAGSMMKPPCSSSGGSVGTPSDLTVPMIIKFSASGVREWRLPIPGEGSGCQQDGARGIAFTGAADFVVGAQISRYNANQKWNFQVMKYRQGAGCVEAPFEDNQLQVRNNIVRRAKGEVAYLTVKSTGGGQVDFSVYGVSGKKLGDLSGVSVPTGGTAEVEFDGKLEGIDLSNGTYWIVADGAAHGRQPVILLGGDRW